MRRPRLKAPAFLPVAYYHCVSRVVDRKFILGDEEKDKLVAFMRTYERLYGLRVPGRRFLAERREAPRRY